MSLHEKSAQTISGEIEDLTNKKNLNLLRIEVLTDMLHEMKKADEILQAAITERENQLNLRAKQRI
jgi:hypothetical protein